MRDFLFQIFLFLLGSIIGITVPLLSKRGQKWTAGVLAILLIAISLIWTGYELATITANTAPPTGMLAPTIMPSNTSVTAPTSITTQPTVAIEQVTPLLVSTTIPDVANTALPTAMVVPTDIVATAVIADRRSILRNYEAIYRQSGWCGVWQQLVSEGGASGNCPNPRYDQTSDSDVGIVDKFVATKSGYIIGFVIQADEEITINYPNCVSFDPTNLAVQSQPANHRVVKIHSNGWVATDIKMKGPFTIYLDCDDVTWPNP